jgi:hypothetical protein
MEGHSFLKSKVKSQNSKKAIARNDKVVEALFEVQCHKSKKSKRIEF